MPTQDEHRRTRHLWVGAVVVVALAVAIPVIALFVHSPSPEAAASGGITYVTSPVTPPPTPTPTPAPTPSVTASAAPARATGAVRALFFGDSYFIGGGYTTVENSMARLAGNRLGWRSVIHGGGGTGFVQANPEYDLPNFLGQIDNGAFDVGRRSWVVIEGGNDDRFLDQTLVSKNARKVLRIAHRRFPRAQVVLVGPLDTDGDYSDTTPVTKTLRKAARKRGVPFVDARKWLKGHFDLIGPDYTHPYPEGHRICAKKLTRALRRLGA